MDRGREGDQARGVRLPSSVGSARFHGGVGAGRGRSGVSAIVGVAGRPADGCPATRRMVDFVDGRTARVVIYLRLEYLFSRPSSFSAPAGGCVSDVRISLFSIGLPYRFLLTSAS